MRVPGSVTVTEPGAINVDVPRLAQPGLVRPGFDQRDIAVKVPQTGVAEFGSAMQSLGDVGLQVAARRKLSRDTVEASNLYNALDSELSGIETELTSTAGSQAYGVTDQYSAKIKEISDRYNQSCQDNSQLSELFRPRMADRFRAGVKTLKSHEVAQERVARDDTAKNELGSIINNVSKLADISNFSLGKFDGMISEGNLDLNNRPVVQNADGSVSTVRSLGIGIGKDAKDLTTVLIPTVVVGRVVSDEDAIKHYRETGENLGTFKDPVAANAYAQALHQQQDKLYGPDRREPVQTVDRALGEYRNTLVKLGLAPEQVERYMQTADEQVRANWLDYWSATDPRRAMAQGEAWLKQGKISGDVFTAAKNRCSQKLDDDVLDHADTTLRARYGKNYDAMQTLLASPNGRQQLGISYDQAQKLKHDYEWEQDELRQRNAVSQEESSRSRAQAYQGQILKAQGNPKLLESLRNRIKYDLGISDSHRSLLLDQAGGSGGSLGTIDTVTALNMIGGGKVKETDLPLLVASVANPKDRDRVKASWTQQYGPDKEAYANCAKMYDAANASVGSGKDAHRPYATPTPVAMADFVQMCSNDGLHGSQIENKMRELLKPRDGGWFKRDYTQWGKGEAEGDFGINRDLSKPVKHFAGWSKSHPQAAAGKKPAVGGDWRTDKGERSRLTAVAADVANEARRQGVKAGRQIADDEGNVWSWDGHRATLLKSGGHR